MNQDQLIASALGDDRVVGDGPQLDAVVVVEQCVDLGLDGVQPTEPGAAEVALPGEGVSVGPAEEASIRTARP
ncbi:MAG: hypothetical protein JRH11_06105 [Deltaproteobacteria bacterium]|nr:hypothetical protein [Deltaproteobacteria bacterium]